MTSSDGRPLVAIEGLRHRFGAGAFALEVERLAIDRGERIGVIGPSGCGKSTLLALIAGILQATEGRVRLDGTDWRELDDAARRRARIKRIGLVFQEFELLEHLTVEENVRLPYFVNPALEWDADAAAHLDRIAQRTGIAPLLARRPRQLSHGERQRVAICRALIARPELLLADEPTGNLDPDTARAVLDLFLDEVAASGATLILVTHDHGVLDRFDRVVDLRREAAKAAAR